MALQEGTAGETRTRVLPETRLLAAVIVPFLVAAWVILYLQPDRTGDLFAWPVSPSMTAMLLGGVYLGGAYFFVRAVFAPDWERIALGFLPVAGFATLMGVATILHWDRFTSGHVAFWTWSVIYFTSPFLVLLVWWRNRRLSRTTGAGAHRDELEGTGRNMRGPDSLSSSRASALIPESVSARGGWRARGVEHPEPGSRPRGLRRRSRGRRPRSASARKITVGAPSRHRGPGPHADQPAPADAPRPGRGR